MGIRSVKRRARALGSGLADLAAAELAALRSDLRASVRRAGLGGILVVVGSGLLLCAVAALALAGFEGLTLVLPRWAAALAIACGLAVVGLIVLTVSRAQLRRVEGPVRTLQRHVEDHRDWWRERLGEGAPRGDPGDEGDR
ncbi:MAG: phage holin family protein [Thermoanaerobaculia bacterium]